MLFSNYIKVLLRSDPQSHPDYTLRLTFIDDSVYTVSFKELFIESPGLARLKNPAVFSEAVLVRGEGWTVEWPNLDIQIGADTLWLDAQVQIRLTKTPVFLPGGERDMASP